MKTVAHWIDGREVESSSKRYSPIWNPATGKQQARADLADIAFIDTAVASAAKAFEGWRGSSLSTRSRVLFAFRELLHKNAERIAAVITAEHGKVLSDALGEVHRGIEVVEFACGLPELLKGSYSSEVTSDIDVLTLREPLGVVAGITPFNFPAMVPLWMFPVAIACGNAFVLKPSERDPSAALIIAELWKEAGLPDGVFSVIQGDKVAVDHLLSHPDIAAVSFVGSTPIAQYVHETASASGKRVQALGGAKNHAVVLPDADMDYVVDQLIGAAFGSAGERCMAISVVIAVADTADALGAAVVRRASDIRVGHGTDPSSDMGPVVTADARDRIVGLIDAGVEQGATLLLDGRGVDQDGDGFWVGPTVFSDVQPGMDIYQHEIFGPVLCLMSVPTLGEAIAFINESPYANGVALFTGDGRSARTFQRDVEVGMLGINVPIPVPVSYHSFGGWRNSLFGDTHVYGPEGVRFYTRAKVVTSRWPDFHGAREQIDYNFPTTQ